MWDNEGELIDLRTYEKNGLQSFDELDDLVEGVDWAKVNSIAVTGGRSMSFKNVFKGIDVLKVNEIDAIGNGGRYLFHNEKPFLVVSMGTGTCMVKVSGNDVEHVGGTGVGGGTFLGLSKMLLGETDIEKLREMFSKGDLGNVDLSVRDIVGSGIGIVSGDATASNLGRLSREINFESNDLASGIVNLIGQTIGVSAVFAAKASGCETIVLAGKLTRVDAIVEVVKKVGEVYGLEILVPEDGLYVSCLGAGEILNKKND